MSSPTRSAGFVTWISGVLSPLWRASSVSPQSKASTCFSSSPMLFPSAWSCSIFEVAAWFGGVCVAARQSVHNTTSTPPPTTTTEQPTPAQQVPRTRSNHFNHFNNSSTIVTTSNSKRKGAGKKAHQLGTLYKISAATSFQTYQPEDGPDFVMC